MVVPAAPLLVVVTKTAGVAMTMVPGAVPIPGILAIVVGLEMVRTMPVHGSMSVTKFLLASAVVLGDGLESVPVAAGAELSAELLLPVREGGDWVALGFKGSFGLPGSAGLPASFGLGGPPELPGGGGGGGGGPGSSGLPGPVPDVPSPPPPPPSPAPGCTSSPCSDPSIPPDGSKVATAGIATLGADVGVAASVVCCTATNSELSEGSGGVGDGAVGVLVPIGSPSFPLPLPSPPTLGEGDTAGVSDFDEAGAEDASTAEL